MSAKSTITVSPIAVRRRGQRITVEPGTEHEARLRVLSISADGWTATVTRWCWYHTLMAQPGRWWRRFRWWLRMN